MEKAFYYVSQKHHSIISHWMPLQATSTPEAIKEAMAYTDGYLEHKTVIGVPKFGEIWTIAEIKNGTKEIRKINQ